MIAMLKTRRRTLSLGTALATCLVYAGAAQAAPELPGTATVVSGLAVVPVHASTDTSLTVNLHNSNSVINWTTFGIGAGQTVSFVSTNGSGVVDSVNPYAVLNRVSTTGGVSNILGSLKSQNNIEVWLSNQNGIVFGSGGTFNGGSLVLTTANVTNANFANSLAGLSTNFSATAGTVTLSNGSAISVGRNVLVVAQQIATDGAANATGAVALVSAADVTFPSGAGSPLSFTINTGTSLSGVQVLSHATLSGASVVVGAMSSSSAVNTLLQVDPGATLTATSNSGTVTLTTGGSGANVFDNIVSSGSLKSAGSVIIEAAGAALVNSQVTAGGDYSVSGNTVALGNGAAAVTQSALGKVTITSSAAGGITGDAGLTLQSNVGATASTNTLILDAGATGTVTFAAGSTLSSGSTAAGAVNAAIGIRDKTTGALGLGDVTAGGLGDYDGTAIAATFTGGSDFTAGTITTEKTLDATFTGKITLASVNAFGTNADISLFSHDDVTTTGLVKAKRNIVVSSQGTAAIKGAVDAGGGYAVQGGTVALGNGAAAVSQSAVGGISISTGSSGSITGDAGLTLAANRNATSAANTLTLDASPTGSINFASGSLLSAGSTVAGSVNAAIGLQFGPSNPLNLGNVTGLVLANYNGATIGTQLSGRSDFTAGTIITDQTFNANFGGRIALANVTASGANADVVLAAGGTLTTTGLLKAARHVTLSSSVEADIEGGVSAGGSYTIQAATIALGNGAAVVAQSAAGKVSLTAAAGGSISGGSGLTLSSNAGTAPSSANTLIIDASLTGSIDFAPGSKLSAGNAAIGLAFDRITLLPGPVALRLGDASAARIADFVALTSTIGTQLTGLGDFTAGSLVTDAAFNANFGGDIAVSKITTNLAGSDVILNAGGVITGSQITAPALNIVSAGDATLTAAKDVTLGTVTGGNLAVHAGSLLGSGSITLADGETTGDIGLYATGLLTGGNVLVTKAVAGGALTIDNLGLGGTHGDIKIAGSLQSTGLLSLISAHDILVASYTGSGTTGTVTSTAGAISATALGSVLGYDPVADAALAAVSVAQSGVGTITATGNLYINSAAGTDTVVGSLSAGGNLSLTLGGNLYGTVPLASPVPGGFFQSATTTLLAANALTGVVNASKVASGGALTITAAKAAIGELSFVSPIIDLTSLLGGIGSSVYVGLISFTGDGVVTLGSPGTAISSITAGNYFANAANLSAGGNIVGSVGGVAQIGTATAGGIVSLEANGIVAGTVTATTNLINLEVSQGTLAVGTATAATTLELKKQGGGFNPDGTLDTAGDELRFGTLTSGTAGVDGLSGDITVISSTNVLGGSASALGGSIFIKSGYQSSSGFILAPGAITGLTAGTGVDLSATNLGDVPDQGRIFVQSGALAQLGTLSSAAAMSIIAGDLVSPLNGAVRIVSADAGGSLYISNKNVAVGTASGIEFGSLTAGGDIVAITSIGNGGDLAGTAITAAGNVSASVGSISVDSITATAGNLALAANGTGSIGGSSVSGTTLSAGGGIAAQAGSSIDVLSALASGGDAAFLATGVLTAGSITAADDASLTGSSVRVGSVLANGTGGDATDVDFVNQTTISDPYDNDFTFTALVPTVAGPQLAANIGGNVFVTATAGDVSGLAVDPAVTPALGLVTTDAALSGAYGSANLTASQGGITVNASGGAQLGTLSQGAGGISNGNITVTAGAVSIDTAQALTGSVGVTANTGTLVIGTGTAAQAINLLKLSGNALVDGDELRVIGAAGLTAGSNLSVISTTNIRGTQFTATDGDFLVQATNDVTGLKTGTIAELPLAWVSTGPALSTTYGHLDLSALADDRTLAVFSSGAVQLGTVIQGTSTSALTATGVGEVLIKAAALSADSITSRTGGIDLTASSGTLALGSGSAAQSILIQKLGGNLGTPGDELRFDTLVSGLYGQPNAGSVIVNSSTNVRGNQITATGGPVTVNAGLAAGVITQAGEITGLAYTTAAPTALGITTTGAGNAILTTSGGLSQLGVIKGDGDISILAGDAAAPLDGAIRIGSADAGGNLYLTNNNHTAGSATGIGFGTLTAGSDAVLITGAGNGGGLIGSTITAGGTVSASIGTDILVDTITATGGNIALLASGGRISDSLGSVGIALTAGGGIGVQAGLEINLASAVANGGDAAFLAGGQITGGTITAADDATVTGTGVSLVSIIAKGTGSDTTDVDFANPVSISDPNHPAFSGSVSKVGGPALAANTGGNVFVTATAGDIAISDTASAQASALLGATGSVSIATGTATTGSLGILAGGDVGSSTALAAGADLAIKAGGQVLLGTATAGDDLTVDAAGPITAAALTITGLGADTTSVSFGTAPVLSISGTETLPANNLSIHSSGGDIGLGAVTVSSAPGTAIARIISDTGAVGISGDVAIAGGLTVSGNLDVTLGDAQSRTQTAQGLVSITSVTGGIRQGAGHLTLGANSDGTGAEPLTLAAKTDVALGTTDLIGGFTFDSSHAIVPTRQSAIGITASTGAITIGSATGAAFTASSGTGFTANGPIIANGKTTISVTGGDVTLPALNSADDVAISAGGTIFANGGITATGKTVTLTAKDAQIPAAINALNITVIDSAASANTLTLGGDPIGSGFDLSNTEVGNLKATGTLTFDAASGTTKQDIAIGTLTLAGPQTVSIFANGTRIDVTGEIGVSGTTTALQLGGTGTDPAALASVIRVAANADGTDGSIHAPAANVDLRAANIGFGQDAGFLAAASATSANLDLAPSSSSAGTGNAANALSFNNHGSSSMYNAQFGTGGGAAYRAANGLPVILLSANNLKVTYTNFALFQNTGSGSATTGVAIGDRLSINSAATQPVFGAFGTIAGKTGIAAALLVSNIDLNADIPAIIFNKSSARINGCIIGEGSGCISLQAFAPSLAAIDAVRPNLLTIASNFEIPFNPLIGTNNDALFGDVGSSGLDIIPLAPIECSDPKNPVKNPQCPAPKKDGQ